MTGAVLPLWYTEYILPDVDFSLPARLFAVRSGWETVVHSTPVDPS